jgi:integrase
MKVRLTETRIVKQKLPETGAIELNDTDAPGLICRITAGGAKTMSIKGRIRGAGTFRMALGDYRQMSMEQWRDEAHKIMRKAKTGEDPRLQPHEDLSFADARDQYLANPPVVSRGPRKGKPWSEIYKRDTTRYLTQTCRDLERSKLRSIKPVHISDTINRVKSVSLRRGLYAAISAFLSWCVDQNFLEISPALGMKAPPSAAPRDRELSTAELRAVLLATVEMGYPDGHIYRLMLLTGKRKNEVAKMRWENVDLETGLWTILSSQTKTNAALVEPLSRQAISLLRSCPQFGPYVFTTNGQSPCSGFSKFEKKLYTLCENNGDDPWRPHDFRRSMVSTAAREFKTPFEVADRALNHAGGARGVAKVYQKYELLDERAKLAQQWADWLHGEPQLNNVVTLNEGR